MVDATKEAAKILSNNLGITVDEACVIVFVDMKRNSKGEIRLGPMPDVQVDDCWVSRSYIVSSEMSTSAVDCLLKKGLLLSKPIEKNGKVIGRDGNWVRTTNSVSLQVDAAYDELEKTFAKR